MWTGAPHGDGYGEFWLNGRRTKAHIAAFYLSRGRMPSGVVRHRCDNPICVRPTHLLEGTQADNVRDMISRGRAVAPPVHRGEDHPNAKLRAETVVDIRAEYAAGGVTYREIADELGMASSTIGRIVRGELWLATADRLAA